MGHARVWSRALLVWRTMLEEAFHRRKRLVWVSWRMDETSIRVKGEWRDLYCAVDKNGQTIDFLLTEHRDKEAALRFLTKAIRRNGAPATIPIDGSEAKAAAINSYNEAHGTAIVIRQVKYLNSIVEVRFVDQKPILNKVWGIGPELKSNDALGLENLMPVSV